MARIALALTLATALAQNTALNAQSFTSHDSAKVPSASASEPKSSSLARNHKTGASTVAASTPVITIHGLCDSSSEIKHASKANCTTVLTRRDFEGFVQVMNATTTRGIDPGFYRGLAEGYTALLVSSQAGEKAGVDKDQRFDQLLNQTRLRALGGMYRSQQYAKALDIPSEEVEADYKKNIDKYEEVDLDRFLLPEDNPLNLGDEAFRKRSKQLADELQARAAKGEDIAKLEKEGLAALGDTKLPFIAVAVRRGQIEENAEKAIFALKQGEVTPVLEERGLWMFFKRTDRQTLSLDAISSEIRTRMFHDRLDAVDKTLHDAVRVDYNPAYFGAMPSPDKAAAQRPARRVEVGPKDAVMTIHGLCADKKQDASNCTIVVSREQFEPVLRISLLTASKSSPVTPRDVAKDYLDVLIYGQAGIRAGLEQDPRFADIMKLSRKRALSDMYHVILDEQAQEASASEIKDYYNHNSRHFEELRLRIVSVPKGEGKNSPEIARIASALRDRAARGEDMDKLQHEAYEATGMKSKVPGTMMSPIRLGAMDQSTESKILALKPGELTDVIELPSAYVCYQFVSRRIIPLEEAKPEITAGIYQQKLPALMRAAGEHIRVDFNERYFASSASHSQLSQVSAPRATVAK